MCVHILYRACSGFHLTIVDVRSCWSTLVVKSLTTVTTITNRLIWPAVRWFILTAVNLTILIFITAVTLFIMAAINLLIVSPIIRVFLIAVILFSLTSIYFTLSIAIIRVRLTAIALFITPEKCFLIGDRLFISSGITL